MSNGESFEDAFTKAKEHICPNGFDEIQKETIYLLNTNKIIAMKKLMYSIGLLAAIGTSTGVLFKILHLPGGDQLFTYGFLGIVLLFIPLLAIDRYKLSISKVLSERLKIILGFSSAMIIGVAILLKLMHLKQFGDILLIAGAVIFILGFLPFLFFRMYSKSIS
ncbi:MAG: hypothetical protein EBR30_12585 [Cytophagia bacterium]|nr:hypothetical protein [Cytophagia bacterium]NBW35832.1 hypothetical protein [Cytophagia bacterium]